VRPLARKGRKGNVIPATPPDRMETWTEGDIEFRAEFRDNLVLPDVKVYPGNPTFTMVAIYDPRFRQPWLLACPLCLTGVALRGLYRDRWSVEQVPLAGKQIWMSLSGILHHKFAKGAIPVQASLHRGVRTRVDDDSSSRKYVSGVWATDASQQHSSL